jgi:hypothetical protein
MDVSQGDRGECVPPLHPNIIVYLWELSNLSELLGNRSFFPFPLSPLIVLCGINLPSKDPVCSEILSPSPFHVPACGNKGDTLTGILTDKSSIGIDVPFHFFRLMNNNSSGRIRLSRILYPSGIRNRDQSPRPPVPYVNEHVLNRCNPHSKIHVLSFFYFSINPIRYTICQFLDTNDVCKDLHNIDVHFYIPVYESQCPFISTYIRLYHIVY